MNRLQQKTRAISAYCVLGLQHGADRREVERVYEELREALDESKFLHSPQGWVQAGQALLEIDNAYERILNGEEEVVEDDNEPFWPKLGQVLVEAGKITFEQLQRAIKEQQRSKQHLGQVLIGHGVLTEEELAAFLDMQRTMELPDSSPRKLAQRLIGLRVVPEDMVCVALIEHCRTRIPVGDILVGKGWLNPELLRALRMTGERPCCGSS